MSLAAQIQRLGKHSAIYGLGGLIQRIVAVLLLPLYTRYLSPSDYGAIEVLVALSAVVFALLRAGIQSSFFRFYLQAEDERARQTVVRTSFWFTMGAATIALVVGLALAGPISTAIFSTSEHADLVRAAFVGLWASMNYDQLTALFRVEERSVSYSIASLANVLFTVGATILLVVVLDQGPLGVLVGNFSGTLAVYAVLLVYRRTQLGLEFDSDVFRRMTAWGMPFVPSVIALNLIDFSDRFFLVRLRDDGQHELGLYAIGMRISAGLLFLLAAFRTAWPAFAYSLPEEEAKRTYGYVLTYVTFFSSWAAVALGLGSPWLVRLLTTPDFYGGARVVPVLVFAFVVFGMYVVVVTSIGRAGRRGSNWMITGAAALLNVALNLILIPPYGMTGAAISMVASYFAMFLGITWKAQRVFPVIYQWRRVALAIGTAVVLVVTGKLLGGLPAAIALTAAYPFLLALTGFYLPQERARIGAFGRRFMLGRV